MESSDRTNAGDVFCRSVFLGLIFEDMRPALGCSFRRDLCAVVCSRRAGKEHTAKPYEHAAGEWRGAVTEEEEEVEEGMGNSSPAAGRLFFFTAQGFLLGQGVRSSTLSPAAVCQSQSGVKHKHLFHQEN